MKMNILVQWASLLWFLTFGSEQNKPGWIWLSHTIKPTVRYGFLTQVQVSDFRLRRGIVRLTTLKTWVLQENWSRWKIRNSDLTPCSFVVADLCYESPTTVCKRRAVQANLRVAFLWQRSYLRKSPPEWQYRSNDDNNHLSYSVFPQKLWPEYVCVCVTCAF